MTAVIHATVRVVDLLAALQQGRTSDVRHVLRRMEPERLARLWRMSKAASTGAVPTEAQRAQLDELLWLAAEAKAERNAVTPYAKLLAEVV